MATVNQQIDKMLRAQLERRLRSHGLTLKPDKRAGVFDVRSGAGAAAFIVDVFDTLGQVRDWLDKQETAIRAGRAPKWQDEKVKNAGRLKNPKSVRVMTRNPVQEGIGLKPAKERMIFDYLIQERSGISGVWLTIGGANSPECAKRFANAEHASYPHKTIRVMDQREGK